MREKPVCVNLGCGPSGIDGWINLDWGVLPLLAKLKWLRKILVRMGLLAVGYEVEWPEFRLRDIRKRLPFEDNSVYYIYCSHVLEHFEKWETVAILGECRRVLKKGGVLRVVLPDLVKIIDNYTDAETFNREYFGFDKDLYVGFLGKLNRFFIRGHEWMYDEESFLKISSKIGFGKKLKVKRLEGETPDLDKLDLKLHEALSFYYELKK